MGTTTQLLSNDQVLNVGDTLASANGEFQLTLQSSGSLVLTGPGATWRSPIAVAPASSYFAIMQSDGNFCVYSGAQGGRSNVGVWSTMCLIPNGGPCFAVVEDDGNVCVYRGTGTDDKQGLLWSTDTAGLALIQKWAPIVHLHPADRSRPDSVENYLAIASLEDGSGNATTPATLTSLATNTTAASYLQFSDGLYPSASQPRVTGAPISGTSGTGACTAPVYVKSFVYDTHVDIKYIYFYPCQNFQLLRVGIGSFTTQKRTFEWSPLGRHGGDWEHVTVRLDPSGQQLLGIFCGQHHDAVWMPNGAFGVQGGTHPVVWAALNSHAVYTTQDTFTTGSVLPSFLAFLLAGPWSIAWLKAVDTTAFDDGLVMYWPALAPFTDIVWDPSSNTDMFCVLDRNPTAETWLNFPGCWGPPRLDNTNIDPPPLLPGRAGSTLLTAANGAIAQGKMDDEYKYGAGPTSPLQQGWWNSKEPFPAPVPGH